MQEEDIKLCHEVLTFHRLREQKSKTWNDLLEKTCQTLPKSIVYKTYNDIFHEASRKEKPDRAFIYATDRLRKKAFKKLPRAEQKKERIV